MKCTTCNKTIQRPPSLLRGKNNFCNHSCYSVFKSKKWKEDKNPRWSGGVGKYTCKTCGKEFTPKGLRSRNNKYCSMQCSAKDRGEQHLGEKHWNWKGGIDHRHLKRTAPPKPEKCEVCKVYGNSNKQGLNLDHDHKTRKFRGWLCTRCNVTLGYAKDSPELLIALATYLTNHK